MTEVLPVINNKTSNKFMKEIMIDGYLEDGSQIVADGIIGKYITDGCLGWKKTEDLVLRLADILLGVKSDK